MLGFHPMNHRVAWRSKALLTLALHLAAFSSITAQAADHTGTEFWLVAPQGDAEGALPSFTIFVINHETFSVDLEIAETSPPCAPCILEPEMFTMLRVPPGSAKDQALLLSATGSVSVFAVSRIGSTPVSSGYLALPATSLGREYVALNRLYPECTPQVIIVATEDGGISCEPAFLECDDSTPILEGEMKVLAPAPSSVVITTTNTPIAVFSSQSCPMDAASRRRRYMEQLPPTTAWGRRFFAFPLDPNRTDALQVVASVDDTNVTIRGHISPMDTNTHTWNLMQGEAREIGLGGATEIISDEPILVAQHSADGSLEDPTTEVSMTVVPPVERYLASYSIVAAGSDRELIGIVAPDDALQQLRVGDEPLSSFVQVKESIGDSGFTVARLMLDDDFISLQGPAPFGVLVYGFSEEPSSYGYVGGLNLSPEAASLELVPATGEAFVGLEYCLEARVDYEVPFEEETQVTFAVAGANPTFETLFTTDGVATFCYKGDQVGVDTVAASVVSLSASATVTWKKLTIADLAVEIVDAPEAPASEKTFDYSTRAGNGGPGDVEDAIVEHAFPSTLTCSIVCEPDAGTSCGPTSIDGAARTLVDLPANRSATFFVSCDATDVELPLRFAVSVTPPEGVQDKDLRNNEAETTTEPPLQISNAPSRDRVFFDETFTFRLDVSHERTTDATGVVVSDVLDRLVFEADDCGGSLDGKSWTWELGTLPSGESESCTLTVRLDSDCASPGLEIDNTATVDADGIPQARATATVKESIPGLCDGDFESGTPSPYWEEESEAFFTPICNPIPSEGGCGDGDGTAGPRGGGWWAWFGGAPFAFGESSSLEQTIHVPDDRTTLSLWLWNGASTTAGNTLRVLLDGDTVFEFVERDPAYADGYAEVTCDLSDRAGSTLLLRLEYSTEDAGPAPEPPAVTNFSLDDVSFVSKPPDAEIPPCLPPTEDP